MISASRQPNTVKAYVNWYNKFLRWAQGYDELKVLPASELAVSMFLLSLHQQGVSVSSLNQCISALNWIHRLTNVPRPVDSPMVKLILEGASRLAAKSTVRKNPITVQIIERLKRGMEERDGSINLMDLRLLTFVLLSFAGFFRYEEAAHITMKDITFHETHVAIFLEKSKTDVYREGKTVIIAKTDSHLCPVTCLKLYLNKAAIPEKSDYYIFRNVALVKSTNTYILRPGNAPISYTQFRELLLSKLQNLGLDPQDFGMHSLRAGGATAAAAAGITERLFLIHGRWRNRDSKERYILDMLTNRLKITMSLGL